MAYKQEEIKPYNPNSDKGEQIAHMFNNIAHSYDKLNHRLSWNIDKWWRKTAVCCLKKYNPQSILDIATGTGDFAIQSAHMLTPKLIVGADISDGMLEIGKGKVKKLGLDSIITFKKEDCMNLSFDANTFDAVTAAFGIRNFADLDRGIKEMHRVLKKGGHLSIVELTAPVSHPMKDLFKIYSHTFLPLYGKLISHDKEAYSYLTATIEAFPQGEKMVDILKNAGFTEASFKRHTFGICTTYFATK